MDPLEANECEISLGVDTNPPPRWQSRGGRLKKANIRRCQRDLPQGWKLKRSIIFLLCLLLPLKGLF